jgi:hypothetical protein
VELATEEEMAQAYPEFALGVVPPARRSACGSGAHPPKLGSSLPDGVRRATANIPVPLAPATTILPSG